MLRNAHPAMEVMDGVDPKKRWREELDAHYKEGERLRMIEMIGRV